MALLRLTKDPTRFNLFCMRENARGLGKQHCGYLCHLKVSSSKPQQVQRHGAVTVLRTVLSKGRCMLLYNPRHTASKSLVEDREDLRAGKPSRYLPEWGRMLSSIEKQVNLSNNQSPKALV